MPPPLSPPGRAKLSEAPSPILSTAPSSTSPQKQIPSSGTTGGIMFLGWQSLFVRPMAWLIAGWGLFLAVLFVNSVLIEAVPLARFVRVVLPFVLCFAGIITTIFPNCLVKELCSLKPRAAETTKATTI